MFDAVDEAAGACAGRDRVRGCKGRLGGHSDEQSAADIATWMPASLSGGECGMWL